jgi:hypothetical protein
MKIKQSSTLNRRFSLILRGESGSGKTFKAAQFPKPLFLCFEQNLSGVKVDFVDVTKGEDDLPLPQSKVWDNFMKVLEEAIKSPDYYTIVVDSATSMLPYLFAKVTGRPYGSVNNDKQQATIGEWGSTAGLLVNVFTRYFAADHGKNAIFIVHETVKFISRPGIGETQTEDSAQHIYRLYLPAFAKDVGESLFSDSWRCYSKPGKPGQRNSYWVRTEKADTHNAKHTLDCPVEFEWDQYKDRILSQVCGSQPQTK